MSVFLLVCLIFLYHCLFHVSFFPYLFIARSFGQFVTERQSNLNCIYLYFRLIDDLLLLLRRGHAQELHQYSQVKTNSTGRLMVYCCCCCLPCTIVAIGHGMLKKFWPFGTRLRSTHFREFNYLKLCRPAYFIRTTQLLPHPSHGTYIRLYLRTCCARMKESCFFRRK